MSFTEREVEEEQMTEEAAERSRRRRRRISWVPDVGALPPRNPRCPHSAG